MRRGIARCAFACAPNENAKAKRNRASHALFSQRNNVFLPDHENVEWLSTLSKDVKLRRLRERIIDVARNERNGLLMFQMGVFLVFAGVIISVLRSEERRVGEEGRSR